MLFSTILSAQMVINQTGTVTQWVQNVLTGPGVSVSNVTYTGDMQSIATFTSGLMPTSINMNSGVILCTGNAQSIPGGVNSFASTNTSGLSDPLLAALITNPINDAAVLEFDFIPLSDTVSFKYIFGSEEYPEYSVSQYNDIFGFFISGFNPSGGMYNNVNVALIPGTSTPVSIANINNGNSNTGPCINCNLYVDNSGSSTISYDAFTVPLYATFSVIPCLTYHIKMVIGDAQDHSYDSGVFFEANSFSATVLDLSYVTSSNVDTIAVEACNDAIVTFRLPEVTSVAKTYYFFTNGNATEGVDYNFLPNTIVIPAGSDSASLVISPLYDGITEGIEYIELIVATSGCTYDTLMVYIQDNVLIECALPNDTTLCNNDSMTLVPLVSGGYLPYEYLWSNGDTNSSLFISPNSITTYSLTVTDACNQDTNDQVIIYASNPKVLLVGDSSCINDSVFLQSIAPASYSHRWSTGEITPNISFPIYSSSYYGVIITDTLGCSDADSTYVKAYVSPNATVTPDHTICKGDETKLEGGGSYYSYEWSGGQDSKSIEVSPLQKTRYSLLVKSNSGCWDTTSVLVGVIDVPEAEIFCDIDTLCRGNFIDISASEADAYLWSTGEVSQVIRVQPTSESLYILKTVFIENGTSCYDETSFNLIVENCNKIFIPNAFSPNSDGLNDKFGVSGNFVAIDHFKMLIYSRNGQLLFSSHNIEKKWNGKFHDEYVPSDVYTYIINITESFGEPYILKGTVQVLR